MSKGPRILYYDLETSLQLAAIFSLAHNDYINPDALVTERYVICACYKWEGDDKVRSISVLDDPKRYAKNHQDDAYVVKALHKLMSEADVIVGHNADQFDKKYINTRALYHGLPALPPIASIDTYKVAKANFLFNSNRLNYIGKLLGAGEKIQTTPGLWMRVMQGEKAAVREMIDYCKQDVLLLEKVFLKLRPYCSTHVNRELFGEVGCPRCGSSDVQSRGIHKAISKTYQRFQCQACGGWFRKLRAEEGATEYRVL